MRECLLVDCSSLLDYNAERFNVENIRHLFNSKHPVSFKMLPLVKILPFFFYIDFFSCSRRE